MTWLGRQAGSPGVLAGLVVVVCLGVSLAAAAGLAVRQRNDAEQPLNRRTHAAGRRGR